MYDVWLEVDRSPGAMKKNNQEQMRSPEKPGTPAHIIQLKPKNM